MVQSAMLVPEYLGNYYLHCKLFVYVELGSWGALFLIIILMNNIILTVKCWAPACSWGALHSSYRRSLSSAKTKVPTACRYFLLIFFS